MKQVKSDFERLSMVLLNGHKEAPLCTHLHRVGAQFVVYTSLTIYKHTPLPLSLIHPSSPRPSQGQPVFLVIRGMELQWMESEGTSPTTIQPINRIRVWGIGLENDR